MVTENVLYPVSVCEQVTMISARNASTSETYINSGTPRPLFWIEFICLSLPYCWYFVKIRFYTAVIFLQTRNTIFVAVAEIFFLVRKSVALGLLGWRRLWMELICRKLDDLHLFQIPGMVCCYIQVGSLPSEGDHTASTDPLSIFFFRTFSVWPARFGN